MTDKNVTAELLWEAYNRTREEVKAQHILVRTTNQDTLAALNQIQTFRSRFLNESFEIALAYLVLTNILIIKKFINPIL